MVTAPVFLGLASAVLVAAIAVPRLLPRMPLWARASWQIAVLILLTLLAEQVVGSPLHPDLQGDAGWQRFWEQCIVVGWWVLAARSAAGVARALLFLESRSRETQILSDLIGAGLYAATILAVVDVVFAVPVGGLIATSGVVAVVIGLALQSTLSDVFSGIAIDIERPYRAGDLITIEGGVDGVVLEVNWRSTRVVTGNGDVAIVPNNVIAKSRLVNHSLPVPVRSTSVEVSLDPETPSDRGIAVLRAAVRACLRPLPSPEPSINLVALRGDGAVYEISFSVPSSNNLAAARTELLAQVQRHLRHAAVPLAVAGLSELPRHHGASATRLLLHSDLFGVLSTEDQERLAAGMTEVSFDEGDILFAQGDAVTALYLIASGTIGVVRTEPDGRERVRRMSPGQCLGIVGLVTGVPFGAEATALAPVHAYRLDKPAIAAAIKERPDLAEGLERLAQRNLAAMLQDAAAEDEAHAAHKDALLPRMRMFLRMLGSHESERAS